MEELNALDLEVVRRALAHPEMQRWADQVVAVSQKLGLPPPEWTTPRPEPVAPSGGS